MTIKIGISARHVHLNRDDLDTLFGNGYELTKQDYQDVCIRFGLDDDRWIALKDRYIGFKSIKD
jgi:hypothetical protein